MQVIVPAVLFGVSCHLAGPLSIPSTPDIPGLQGFKGTVMHTAAWDSSIDLAGKRIAVVGTGASAIQVIPHLQEVTAELVVFQVRLAVVGMFRGVASTRLFQPYPRPARRRCKAAGAAVGLCQHSAV